MATAQLAVYIREEEYLQGEMDARIKHEYINGEVYAMAGASDKHNLISSNANAILNQALPDECEVFIADMKVRIQTERDLSYYYPDVMVCCAEEAQDSYYREQPCLIVEVLSPSTERQDRFEKFWSYRQLPSLQEYLLLEQHDKRTTLFRRSNDWQPEVYREGHLHLKSVELDIFLDALYRRIKV